LFELGQPRCGIGLPLEPSDIDIADVVPAQELADLREVRARIDLLDGLAPGRNLRFGIAALLDVMFPAEDRQGPVSIETRENSW
jgi:hypothetical protein